MFNPFIETITLLPTPVAQPMIVCENITDEAVLDQIIAFEGRSYGQLVGDYRMTASEVKKQAIKQIIMSADWQFIRAYDEMVANVQVLGTIPAGKFKGQYGFWTWANEDADALATDAKNIRTDDPELAKFILDLVNQINEANWDYEAQRSYYGRYGSPR